MRGKLVDFYDGADHVHIWGLKFTKDEYLGSEILRTEKNILGFKTLSSAEALCSTPSMLLRTCTVGEPLRRRVGLRLTAS